MQSAYYVNMPPGVQNANKDDLTCLHVHPSWAPDVTKIPPLQAIQQLQRFERHPLLVWELGLECHHGQVIHGDWPMQGIAECYLQASKLRDWLPLRPSSRAENSFLETQHLVTRPDWTFDWTAALILEIGCGDAILNDSSNKTGPPH